MSIKSPVGNQPTPVVTTMNRPTDQPLASERLADGVKSDVGVRELQTKPSGKTLTIGTIVTYSSSEYGSVSRMETTVLPNSPVVVSSVEEGGGDTDDEEQVLK